MKKIKYFAYGIGVLLCSSQLNAVDLTASSTFPSVFFTDTNTNTLVGQLWMNDYSTEYDQFGIWSTPSQKHIMYMSMTPQSEYSIYVSKNGDMTLTNGAFYINKEEKKVGIGTMSPQSPLHVVGAIKSSWEGSNNLAVQQLMDLSVTNTGGNSDVGFKLQNVPGAFSWSFRTYNIGKGFTATKLGTGGTEFEVDNVTSHYSNTRVKMGQVTVFENGHLVTSSSRTLKTNIKALDSKKALEAFRELQPVSYRYKAQKSEPVVGFIAEDVPELVSMPSRKTYDSAEIVALLTKVVQEQDKTLTETKTELKKAQEKIAKLETMQKRLAKVESLLTNLVLDTSNSKTKEVSFNIK